MQDIIDLDTGPVISGEKTVEQMGEAILELIVKVANGEIHTKAERLGQDDLIPWKRGVSLSTSYTVTEHSGFKPGLPSPRDTLVASAAPLRSPAPSTPRRCRYLTSATSSPTP